MIDHWLGLYESHDHPEDAVEGGRYRVEDEEHEDLGHGHPPPHLILQADCHEVEDVEGRCDIVRDEDNDSVLHKPPAQDQQVMCYVFIKNKFTKLRRCTSENTHLE